MRKANIGSVAYSGTVVHRWIAVHGNRRGASIQIDPFGASSKRTRRTADVSASRNAHRRLRLPGAEVVAVAGGTATLKDAMNEAMRSWSAAAVPAVLSRPRPAGGTRQSAGG